MIAPPRMAELIIEALGVDTRFGQDIVGDLIEEFAERVERDGMAAARRWYYRESLRAIPYVMRDRGRRLHWREVTHLAGVAVTSHIFVALIWGAIFATVTSLARLPRLSTGFDLVARDGPVAFATLATGALSAGTGGYIAAWLNRRAPLLGAIATGAAWALVSLTTMIVAGDAPIWYRVTGPLVVVLGTTAGGILRVSTQASTTTGA